MIILDLNQVMISNLMAQIGNYTNTSIEENLFRHMVLNSIRSLKQKFYNDGELIIACDAKQSWRRDIFPHYKANRKKHRENSEIDWSNVFNLLNKIKEELRVFFPYRVIQVEGAEADDVISSLVYEFGTFLNNSTSEMIVIVSGDKDFRQLHKFSNVIQYDPVNKKFIKEESPEKYLKELIICGDRGDGIPNVLSDDDVFIRGVRQKPVTAKKLKTWLEQDPCEFLDDNVESNYQRNLKLIDLSFTPNSIKEKVIEEYCNQKDKPRDKIFNYMINNKMKVLIEHINEF
jgi:5'-3' exonuclease